MSIALSIWNGRIAPVLDVSSYFLIVDPKTGEQIRHIEFLHTEEDDTTAEKKAVFLKNAGVSLLVCGAISCYYEQTILAKDIDILAFVAGPVDSIIQAIIQNKAQHIDFSMPGCGRPRRRRRGGRGGRGKQGGLHQGIFFIKNDEGGTKQ